MKYCMYGEKECYEYDNGRQDVIEELKTITDKWHSGELEDVDFIGEICKFVDENYKDCNNCANATEDFNTEIDCGCYFCCKGIENNYKPIEKDNKQSEEIEKDC